MKSLILVLPLVLLAGCGQQGPLVPAPQAPPEQQEDVTTIPSEGSQG